MPGLMITLALILAVALFLILQYNKMIQLQNRSKEAWSDIDVQLKRRYNLIPNLVETVKGYATHEEQVLTRVTEARNMAINAGTVHDQAVAENMLSGALKSLFAVSESYPDLKANQNFLQLQTELVDTEDKIQAARRFYNGMVRDFNTLIQKFPTNFIANLFKFKDQEFFELENEAEKEVVQVSFNPNPPSPTSPTSPNPPNPPNPPTSPSMPSPPPVFPTPPPTAPENPSPAAPMSETTPMPAPSASPSASTVVDNSPMASAPSTPPAPMASPLPEPSPVAPAPESPSTPLPPASPGTPSEAPTPPASSPGVETPSEPPTPTASPSAPSEDGPKPGM